MPFREISYLMVNVVLFLGMYLAARQYENDYYVIATWPVARSISSLFFIVIANRFFKVNLFTPFFQTLPLLITIPLLAYGFRWVQDAAHLPITDSRWIALAYLFFSGLVYSVFCGLAAFFIPGLSHSDKERIARFLPGGSVLMERYRSRQQTS